MNKVEEFRKAFAETHGHEPEAADYPAYLNLLLPADGGKPEALDDIERGQPAVLTDPTNPPDVRIPFDPWIFQKEPAERGAYFTHLTLRDLFALAHVAAGRDPMFAYDKADEAIRYREVK